VNTVMNVRVLEPHSYISCMCPNRGSEFDYRSSIMVLLITIHFLSMEGYQAGTELSRPTNLVLFTGARTGGIISTILFSVMFFL
jgi:hypothetical protein